MPTPPRREPLTWGLCALLFALPWATYGSAIFRRYGLRDDYAILREALEGLELAERLIVTVSRPIRRSGAELRVGASVGIAVSQDAGVDADALFAEADTAAYRAKAHGRGRAEMFDEVLRLQLNERAELEAAIASGLADGTEFLASPRIRQRIVDAHEDYPVEHGLVIKGLAVKDRDAAGLNLAGDFSQ